MFHLTIMSIDTFPFIKVRFTWGKLERALREGAELIDRNIDEAGIGDAYREARSKAAAEMRAKYGRK